MAIDPVALTARLVEARSYSGEEDAAADVIEAALRDSGLEPRRVERNVWAARGSGERGLLFNSHLDTVPAGPGWTRDPWRAEVVDGKLYGLGSNDAKSCVAAMLAAFVAAPDPGARGRLVFCASAEEEGPGPGAAPGAGCRGLEITLPHLGKLAGAVIGEPTNLAICAGQRGRTVLRLVCEGKSGHASRPHEGVNAIELAARALASLSPLLSDDALGADGLLGRATLCPTLIEGGTKSNVIPARCAITIDCRTTPGFDNATAARRLAEVASVLAPFDPTSRSARGRGSVESGGRDTGSNLEGQVRVEVLNARFQPVVTPRDSAIFRAARSALPGAEVRALGGVSDLFHVAQLGIPGVIVGPGQGAQSHQADEFVRADAVRAAAAAYQRIAEEFFR